MNIPDFIKQYNNHPVLFIGAGFSFRYLNNTYSWDGLLSKICQNLWGTDEKYYDIKSKYGANGVYQYDKIAEEIQGEFNIKLEKDRNGAFKHINDIFYENMRSGVTLSRFKIYISELVGNTSIKDNMASEIAELKKIRKNIGSIITTNYDKFTESIFEFTPLIGNDILMSNPYGSIYKIHGCIDDISNIIITESDYKTFNTRYELIRAQLLSIFIHNPIIFIGYGVGDSNIKDVLKTIFTYIPANSELSNKVKNNFLLIEYEKDSKNLEVTDHELLINGTNIRINKLRTDDFTSIYKALSDLVLPISAMDVRKVQNIVKEINTGGNIKVHITEDIDGLKNSDKILAIGTTKTISIEFLTIPEMIKDYFKIIEESNSSVLSLINKHRIQANQYFPIFAFSKINSEINEVEQLKENQNRNLDAFFKKHAKENIHTSISGIMEDETIAYSYKSRAIFYGTYKDKIDLDELESFLKTEDIKSNPSYRQLLCMFDKKKYSDVPEDNN